MTEKTGYYELVRVDLPEPDEMSLVTAALLTCCLCGEVIDGMGGPGEFICIRCGDVVKSHRAVGAIKWQETA